MQTGTGARRLARLPDHRQGLSPSPLLFKGENPLFSHHTGLPLQTEVLPPFQLQGFREETA